jgi:hypothetical protein
MASEPKDIALAVRIKDAGIKADEADDVLRPTSGNDQWQDMFEELGMEVVDETALPEDDDERRELSTFLSVNELMMQHYHRSRLFARR